MADASVKKIKEGAERVENSRLQRDQCERDRNLLKKFKKKACTKKSRWGTCIEYNVTDEQESNLKSMKGRNHGKTCDKQINKSVDGILNNKNKNIQPDIKF